MSALRLPSDSAEIHVDDWEDFARTYTPHPVAALFPMMSRNDLEELGTDIAAYGLISPIVLDDEMRVVDGRNRLAAMVLNLGFEMRPPRFVRFSAVAPAQCDGIAEYIVSTNISRRHLDPGQRATIVAAAYAHFRTAANKSRSEKANARPRKSDGTLLASRGQMSTTGLKPIEGAPTAHISPQVHLATVALIDADHRRAAAKESPRAWQKVAAAAGVSERMAREALTVVAAASEQKDKVIRGEVKLHTAVKAVKDTTQAKPRKERTLAASKRRIRNVIAAEIDHHRGLDDHELEAWVAEGCGGGWA